MTIVLYVVLYAIGALMLIGLMRAKSGSVSSSLTHFEDAEQMRAIGRGTSVRGVDRDPFATLS